MLTSYIRTVCGIVITMFMTTGTFVSVGLIISLINIVGSFDECTANGKTFLISKEKITWLKAYNKCLSNGGTLLPAEGNITCKVPETTWTSQVYVKTPPIYIKGCFETAAPNITAKIQNNDIPLCYEKCRSNHGNQGGLTHFGLQGDKCVCFNTTLAIEALSGGYCDITCAANRHQICGGSLSYSLFEIAKESFAATGDRMCGYFKSNQNQFLFEKCENEDFTKKSACKKFGSKSIGSADVVSTYLTWDDAEYSCQGKNTNLIGETIETIQELEFIQNSFEDREFWIGLRQWIYPKQFVSSDEVPDVDRLSHCTIRTRDGVQKIPCDEKHQYVCVKDPIKHTTENSETEKTRTRPTQASTRQSTPASISIRNDVESGVEGNGSSKTSEMSTVRLQNRDVDETRIAPPPNTAGVYKIGLGIIGGSATVVIILLLVYKYKRKSDQRNQNETGNPEEGVFSFHRSMSVEAIHPEVVQLREVTDAESDTYKHLHVNYDAKHGEQDESFDVMKPGTSDLYDHTIRNGGRVTYNNDYGFEESSELYDHTIKNERRVNEVDDSTYSHLDKTVHLQNVQVEKTNENTIYEDY